MSCWVIVNIRSFCEIMKNELNEEGSLLIEFLYMNVPNSRAYISMTLNSQIIIGKDWVCMASVVAI